MVPFVNLKARSSGIKGEIDDAVGKILAGGQFVLGDQAAAFEEECGAYSGGHGVAVNSGTSALHLALLAAGVGPGGEVITVPFRFVATAAAIRYTGAVPVFVDIEPRSYTVEPNRLEGTITERTKAVLPVHLFGRPPDINPIRRQRRAARGRE